MYDRMQQQEVPHSFSSFHRGYWYRDWNDEPTNKEHATVSQVPESTCTAFPPLSTVLFSPVRTKVFLYFSWCLVEFSLHFTSWKGIRNDKICVFPLVDSVQAVESQATPTFGNHVKHALFVSNVLNLYSAESVCIKKALLLLRITFYFSGRSMMVLHPPWGKYGMELLYGIGMRRKQL